MVDMDRLETLHTALQRRGLGYDRAVALGQEYRVLAGQVQTALPFAVSTAYAYSPRENVGSLGGLHIVVRVPVHAGRLHREPGDALCKPAAKFWGLDGRENTPATCIGCLRAAVKLHAP